MAAWIKRTTNLEDGYYTTIATAFAEAIDQPEFLIQIQPGVNTGAFVSCVAKCLENARDSVDIVELNSAHRNERFVAVIRGSQESTFFRNKPITRLKGSEMVWVFEKQDPQPGSSKE